MSQPKALSPAEATNQLNQLAVNGTIKLSAHCQHDSMPTRNILFVDIVHLLATGTVTRRPEWSDQYQQWKYRLQGQDSLGDDLTGITVIFDANYTVLVITVF